MKGHLRKTTMSSEEESNKNQKREEMNALPDDEDMSKQSCDWNE
jgi:hypothetical protein